MYNNESLATARNRVNAWMENNNIGFTVTYQGQTCAQEKPYDPIPHIIPGDRFTRIEKGLMQRVNAINLLLCDLYDKRMIVHDGIIPEEFIFTSFDFLRPCIGFTPAKSLYNHISSVDLVCAADGKWYVMQDHLSLPAGASYPLFARMLTRGVYPDMFDNEKLCDNSGYNILLNQLYDDVRQGLDHKDGIVAVLAQPEEEFSDFELNYLAELTGAVYAHPSEITVMDNAAYYRPPEGGGFSRVDIIYRHTPDHLLDPLTFDATSLFGVPHLMEAYRKRKVAIINAPGCAVAEDKGVYYYIPEAIRYYLGEEPILPNVPTYLPTDAGDLDYILSNLDRLVVKSVQGSKNLATVYGSKLDEQSLSDLKGRIKTNPRGYIAQEFIDLHTMDVLSPDGSGIAQCRADYRAFIVHCDSIRVWMGGLTKFCREGGHASNQSGFKDTWILSE